MWLRPADAIILLLAVTAVVVLARALWQPPAPSRWAEVRTPTSMATLDLANDGETAFPGIIGTSTILVEGGRVRFSSSPCRNRVCMVTGWLGRTGDFAACVPNGISVRIAARADGYDSIHY